MDKYTLKELEKLPEFASLELELNRIFEKMPSSKFDNLDKDKITNIITEEIPDQSLEFVGRLISSILTMAWMEEGKKDFEETFNKWKIN